MSACTATLLKTPPIGSPRPAMARRAFTIVELLVVIGIIAVLMSILLPVLSGVRRRARENSCANSERAIFQASMLLVNDLNGHFARAPRRNHTKTFRNLDGVMDLAFAMDPVQGGGVADYSVGLIWKYFGDTVDARKAIFMCANDRGEIAQGGDTGYQNRNFSYSFNSNISPTSTDPAIADKAPTLRLNQVRRPATKIFLWEEIGPNDGYCTGPSVTGYDDFPTNRHGQSGSVARNVASGSGVVNDPNWMKEGYGFHTFFDGHTENLTPEYLTTSANRTRYWDKLEQ